MSLQKLTLIRFCGAKLNAGPGAIALSILVLLSLRFGLFPFWYDDHPVMTYWVMAVAGTVGMLFSLLVHDFSHLLSEKVLGSRPRSLHAYMFGDVSNGDEPTNRKVEWKVAFAGPIASLLLGLIFYGTSLVSDMHGLPEPFVGVFFHLAAGNLTLAFFNFLPFFPLDGGRVLRAMLWRRGTSFVRANFLASRGGLLLSFILIFGGTLLVFNGMLLVGGWLLIFGLALGLAAQAGLERVLMKSVLKGRKVRELMNTCPVGVSPLISLDKLATNYFDKYHFRAFPVTRDNEVLGYVTEKDMGKVPPERWKVYRVSEVMTTSSECNTVDSEETALGVWDLLKENGLDMVMVAERGRLLGVVRGEELRAFVSSEYEKSVPGKHAVTAR